MLLQTHATTVKNMRNALRWLVLAVLAGFAVFSTAAQALVFVYPYPNYSEREITMVSRTSMEGLEDSRIAPCSQPRPSGVQTYERCFIDTPVGVASRTGDVYTSNDDRIIITNESQWHAHELTQGRFALTPIFSNGHGKSFIELPQRGDKKYIGVYGRELKASDLTMKEIGDTKVYVVQNSTQPAIQDANGRLLIVEPGTETFSPNGRWMLVVGYCNEYDAETSNNKSLFLVNVDTSRAQYIGMAYEPTLRTDYYAVSNSGKTVVGVILDGNYFHKDLSQCILKPDLEGECVVDSVLKPDESDKEYKMMTDITLVDDKTMEFTDYGHIYNNNDEGDSFETVDVGRVRMKIGNIIQSNAPVSPRPPYPSDPSVSIPDPDEPVPTVERLKLLVIGDSYISGEGAEYSFGEENGPSRYRDGTNVQDGNKCHLSEVSYPMLIGERLYKDYRLYNSIACSGAKAEHITSDKATSEGRYQQYGQYDYGRYVRFHSSELTTIYNDFSPGRIAQYHFVRKYQPENILISIGGNDMGFADVIAACVLTPTEDCFDTTPERWGLLGMIYEKRSMLVDTYSMIKALSPGSNIYVLGYPKVVAATKGLCSVDVQLSPNERQFSRDLIDKINIVISAAAAEAGVNYVDISEVFKGNELCSTFPTAVNGLVAGGDDVYVDIPAGNGKVRRLNLLGNESYHPTAFGHILISNVLTKRTGNLTKRNPAPRLVDLPDRSTDPFVASAKHIKKKPSKLMVANITAHPVISLQRKIRIYFDSKIMNLTPGESYAVEYHSNPVVAYTGIVPDDGIIDVTFDAPKLEPGPHTLHLISRDANGEDVDVMQSVYMAYEDNDYDGDGLANGNDPFPLLANVEPSRQQANAPRETTGGTLHSDADHAAVILSKEQALQATKDELLLAPAATSSALKSTPAPKEASSGAEKGNATHNHPNIWPIALPVGLLVAGGVAWLLQKKHKQID